MISSPNAGPLNAFLGSLRPPGGINRLGKLSTALLPDGSHHRAEGSERYFDGGPQEDG